MSMADPQHLMHVTGADNVCFTALGKSSKSVQCAKTGPCACITGLQHSALYWFGRFALLSTMAGHKAHHKATLGQTGRGKCKNFCTLCL